MKLVSGDMLWTSIDRIPQQYNYLSEHIGCEVLIIGGGITGAIAAYYLTNAGVDTVLVEKNIIGYGSTRASTSILQYEIDTDLIGLSAMIGEDKAGEAFKLCQQAMFDIKDLIESFEDKCDFRSRDCFYYTTNSSEVSLMKREYELRKSHGFDVEFISKNDAQQYFSFPVEAGIYSKNAAAEIDPYRFTHALINQAREDGLRVFENTEIEDLEPKDDYVNLETTNNFKIKADKVLIATGYEAKNYINKKIGMFSRTFTIVTKPISNFTGWHKRCIIRDNKDDYNYLRTTGDNRIIFGGEDEDLGKEGSAMSNLSNNHPVARQKYNLLLDKLKGYFPDIKDIELEYKFSGVFAVTHDGLPRIGGHSQMPNCYFSLGYGSNGILYAMLGGQLLKDLFLGNSRPELEMFRVER